MYIVMTSTTPFIHLHADSRQTPTPTPTPAKSSVRPISMLRLPKQIRPCMHATSSFLCKIHTPHPHLHLRPRTPPSRSLPTIPPNHPALPSIGTSIGSTIPTDLPTRQDIPIITTNARRAVEEMVRIIFIFDRRQFLSIGAVEIDEVIGVVAIALDE